MSTITTTTSTGSSEQIWSGRKGTSYDWRSVVAQVEASRLDGELLAFGSPSLASADT